MFSEYFSRFTGFEWDENKNRKNIERHSISFEKATEAFEDENNVFGRIEREGMGEERFLLVGATKENILITIVLTFRGNNIRLISARHPKKREINLYKLQSEVKSYKI